MNVTQITGNPLAPSSTDLFSVVYDLGLDAVPNALSVLNTAEKGEGWRILTGGLTHNAWGALAYRYELKAAYPKAFERTDREEELILALQQIEADTVYLKGQKDKKPGSSLYADHLGEIWVKAGAAIAAATGEGSK